MHDNINVLKVNILDAYFAIAAASSNFTERSFEAPSEPMVTP